ncbi:hypothetical protein R5R35_009479 [Gryllus longicercus]|uniref:Uncharacterized protein n=1 Tax=Gryllus longicercus TaxID=2509291 RepID=A0AAN9ZB75_9ORTH
MQITCKCLNVTIETQGSRTQEIDVSTLNLTVIEKSDAFFKEALVLVEHGRISKVQSSLVQVRNVGLWIIHSCMNCSLNTHAIHREKGAAFVLFNKALLVNPEEISALKKNEKYSPVFRIVINHSELEEAALQAPTKFAVSQLPAPVQTAITALQQQLAEIIQYETTRTEERVRQYSEQQYAALEEFRERAHNDHRLLARLLCEAQEKFGNSEIVQPAPLDNLETPPSTPDNHNVPTPLASSVRSVLRSSAPLASPAGAASPVSSQNKGDGPSTVTADFRPSKQPSSPLSSAGSHSRSGRIVPANLFGQGKRQRNRHSFDTEGLFDLEGMEDNPPEAGPSEEESDTDDSGSHDEGIHIPRSRGMHNLAKSLPVNVPSFMPQEKKNIEDMDDDQQLPQDPMDIAASIKALAKSVHGDANVFGDLPRPRFSTQI